MGTDGRHGSGVAVQQQRFVAGRSGIELLEHARVPVGDGGAGSRGAEGVEETREV